MTLRWIISSVSLAFVVVIGLAAFALQENLILFLLNPKTPYETYAPPPAPDYSVDDNWAMLPTGSATDGDEKAAAFYIHSTTYASREEWNAPVDDSVAGNLTMKTALPNEAGPFAGVGDIYAPYYRQATLYAFFTFKHPGRESRKLAYDDVARAFESFMTRIGPERPIFIVGYGQGGLHAQRLLMDYFQDDEALRRRLIAAYLINQATPLDLFNYALANTSACERPDDVRCVISWTAYSRRLENEMWRTRNRELGWDSNGDLQAPEDRELLCTNPLSWRPGDREVSRERHLGAASATGMPFGEQPVLVERAVSATCQDGIVVVPMPSAGWLKHPRWFGRQWAPLNFNLFYEDIRQNARARLAALQEIRAEEATMAPPMMAPVELEVSPINKVPDVE
ncbi:DUF3089 domain-containing protein [Aquisalinus flavus]|uniref:DUF3089 domain-containing protein n=1 Tax=Aquisalinus flavus TaxID=1526572 RepID=A0A8J2Y7L9_9PROT|nr:DUF3089 domain-containing protein [Aquisalinus flavus]MBD0427727.1 DUF3089 domain-containing protein [Aquisalinus flavus]UNE47505.1 DUF3089 domain-containing protein [Aquisalinus flavus]GGD03330.1 hypothetical protein GCM10011342_10420 [Aquisalinus flavus]